MFVRILLMSIFLFGITACSGDSSEKKQSPQLIYLTHNHELYVVNTYNNTPRKIAGNISKSISVLSFYTSPTKTHVAYFVNDRTISPSETKLIITEFASGNSLEIATMQYEGEVMWAPNGDLFAYEKGTFSSEPDIDLWVYNLSNNEQIEITQELNASNIYWASDDSLFFVGWSKDYALEDFGYFLASATTGELSRISRPIQEGEQLYSDTYFWSPSGDYLHYYIETAEQTAIFMVYDAGSGVNKFNIEIPIYAHIRWAPDNSHILFETYNGDLLLASIESESIRNLTNFSDSGLTASYFDWSPDNPNFAYYSRAEGLGFSIYISTPSQINIASLSNAFPLGDQPIESAIYWSYDGQYLATFADETLDGGVEGLYIYDSSSNEFTLLYTNNAPPSEDYFSIDWSPEHNIIAFQTSVNNLSFGDLETGEIYSVPSNLSLVGDYCRWGDDGLFYYCLHNNAQISKFNTQGDMIDVMLELQSDGLREWSILE